MAQEMRPLGAALSLAFEPDVRRCVRDSTNLPSTVGYLRRGVTKRLRKLSRQLQPPRSVLARELDTKAP